MITMLLIVAALQAPVDAIRPARSIPAAARAAIARANQAWLPAMQRQDIDAIVEPYADDAVFVTATGESFRGHAAIAELMRDRFRAGRITGGTLQQDDLVAAGSMIYEWGHADLEVAGGPGAPASRTRGRYLTVWQADASGRWRISRNLSLGN